MEKRLKLSEDNILKTAKSVAEGIIHYEAETFDGKEYIMRVNPMQKCKVCDAANGVESLYPAKLYVDFVGLEEKERKSLKFAEDFMQKDRNICSCKMKRGTLFACLSGKRV